MKSLSDKKVVMTTETTGFSPKEGHKLVEIAAIEIDENDIQTGAVFHAYINPERQISREVTAVHGLNNKCLKQYPTFAGYKDNFLQFIKDKELIGIHIKFDLSFLNNELGFELSNKTTDIFEMAKEAYPKQLNTLSILNKRLKIEVKYPAYNSTLLDTLYILEIYKKLKNKQINNERS